jgi:hypothetical protein
MHARVATDTERNQPALLVIAAAVMDDQTCADATGAAPEPVTL